MTTKRHLRDQVLRVLLGGPLYGSQVVDRLPDEDSDGVRAAVRRLVRDHAIARGSDKRLSIALTVDDLRDLHARLDADADRQARRVEHGRPLTATIAVRAIDRGDIAVVKGAAWSQRGLCNVQLANRNR